MIPGFHIDRGAPLDAASGACPKCGQSQAQCACPRRRKPGKGSASAAAAAADPRDGVVRVGRQTKGRKGKGVTVVTGVPLSGEALDTLGRKLKQRCGAGGTVRDGVIEVQGDHRDRLVAELEQQGYTVKRTGG